jgi:anaerobic magnesium-protoporphyrin IX monomethyl ester cyclase
MVAYERIGLMLLGAIMKKAGHEVRAITLSETTLDGVRETMQQFSPQMVGYTAMTGEHVPLLQLNSALKKDFNFYSVFGGPHAIFSPQVLENEEDLDAICKGEGDIAFPEFVKRIEAGEDYWNTPTFHVKHEGKIVENELGPLVEDLDDLPFPDRKLLYDSDPRMANLSGKAFFTARGCPYLCTYCFNKQYNDAYKDLGKVVRCRSPKRVVEEIEQVMAHYPLGMIHFVDDVFVLKPKGWIEEFSDLYRDRVGVPFAGNVRPSPVSDYNLKKLKTAGMSHVWMGVESGDEKAASDVLARHTGNDGVITAADSYNRNGIKVATFNIMGLPVPNPFETDLKTIDLNLRIKPAFMSSGLLYPYPGSDVATYCDENGYMDTESDFLETNKKSSMLKFSSTKEKMMVENLQKLSGVIVDFPFLRKSAKFLAGLKLPRLYYFLFYLHAGFCHKVKLNSSNRIRINEIPTFFVLFFRLLAKN